ncbi:hypothetical protein [Viridibacillus arvi]|uniref:hypothetical protein n=1 Tax=Viridibacillus arvi TaxID=263475 RepID=UPI0034CE946F
MFPQEITGYHSSEVAYQVRKQSLYMYLRLIKYYIGEHKIEKIEKLNEVDVVEIPLQNLGQQFNQYLNQFKKIIIKPNPGVTSLFYTFNKTYGINENPQLRYKFRYNACRNVNEIHFELVYEYGNENQIQIQLIEGYIRNDGGLYVAVSSKNTGLKKYFNNLLQNSVEL